MAFQWRDIAGCGGPLCQGLAGPVVFRLEKRQVAPEKYIMKIRD